MYEAFDNQFFNLSAILLITINFAGYTIQLMKIIKQKNRSSLNGFRFIINYITSLSQTAPPPLLRSPPPCLGSAVFPSA